MLMHPDASVSRIRVLWPGTWTEKAAMMLRRDLKAARKAWINETKIEAE